MSLWKELQMKPSPAHHAPPLEADSNPVSSAKREHFSRDLTVLVASGQGLLGSEPISLSLLLLRVYM